LENTSPSIDMQNLPRHIGIIMDGNGRWARARNLPRSKGHLEGLTAAKRVVGYLADLPIEQVTLYTFSTENWRRPPQEISYLMGLISKYIIREMPFYREHNIRVRRIGNTSGLPEEVLEHLSKTEQSTKDHTGLQVNLAVNYGGRDDILRAVNRILDASRKGEFQGECREAAISAYLDTAGIPDPELILRSAGEKRLSNFLLWQGAYAEYCFVDAFWPDWDEDIIAGCIQEYQRRLRKFGGTDT